MSKDYFKQAGDLDDGDKYFKPAGDLGDGNDYFKPAGDLDDGDKYFKPAGDLDDGNNNTSDIIEEYGGFIATKEEIQEMINDGYIIIESIDLGNNLYAIKYEYRNNKGRGR